MEARNIRNTAVAFLAAVTVCPPSPALAYVFMRNAEHWTNTIEFEIAHERIFGDAFMSLSGQIEVDPPDELGGFVLLWGCVRRNSSEPSLEVTYRRESHQESTPAPVAPNCERYRLLGTWGRYPGEKALIPQEILGQDVTFSGDFTCDSDLGRWFTGGYVWVKKPYTHCVPMGLADIYYVRGEARRADRRPGLAQINFAKICEEGSKLGGPTMQMRTQVKGASVNGEPVSLDNVPIHISQTSPDFCILMGPGSEGVVLSSGYRFSSVSYSREQALAQPRARNWSSWLLDIIDKLVVGMRVWLAFDAPRRD